jgi:hypothetical protein
MIRIRAPTNRKENVYKNEIHRKKKMGGEIQQDLVGRKSKISVFG